MSRAVRLVLTVGVLVALAWVASVPARIWWDARQEDARPSDAIVVLGAAQYDGTPSPVFEARLRKAQDLYEQGVAPVVVTVGAGAVGDRTTEADAGADWLVDVAGLARDEVLPVATGEDTRTSLDAVGEVFAEEGWSTAVLVSDPWHTFRSKALAAAAGIDAVAAPVRSGPIVQSRGTQLRYILRESGAYIVWRLSGGAAGGGDSS
ncbi:MAG TPA: YdcF family protein [Jiangellales bacterium]|nr:YdcF family protein [Jiangellales bacterium]